MALATTIRAFRKRVQRRQAVTADGDDDAETKSGRQSTRSLREKARADLRRANREVASRTAPVTDELRESRKEGARLRTVIGDDPDVVAARQAAQKLNEKRQDVQQQAAALFDSPVASQAGERARELGRLEEESLEEFGGFDTRAEALGTGVEQPLLFEAVDVAETDGNLTDDIIDPVRIVEGGAEVGTVDLGMIDVEADPNTDPVDIGPIEDDL